MKRVVTEQWVAFDGVPFPIGAAGEDAAETACRAYERRLAHMRLVGLTIEQVEAALSRADPELADAFEVIGSRIARARLAAGEQKYERKPNAKEAPLDPPASADSTERLSSESGGGSSQSRPDGRTDEAAAA